MFCREHWGFFKKKNRQFNAHITHLAHLNEMIWFICACELHEHARLYFIIFASPVPSKVSVVNQTLNIYLLNREKLMAFHCVKWVPVFKMVRILLLWYIIFISMICWKLEPSIRNATLQLQCCSYGKIWSSVRQYAIWLAMFQNAQWWKTRTAYNRIAL